MSNRVVSYRIAGDVAIACINNGLLMSRLTSRYSLSVAKLVVTLLLSFMSDVLLFADWTLHVVKLHYTITEFTRVLLLRLS